jgi:hypothetical protein
LSFYYAGTCRNDNQGQNRRGKIIKPNIIGSRENPPESGFDAAAIISIPEDIICGKKYSIYKAYEQNKIPKIMPKTPFNIFLIKNKISSNLEAIMSP